VGGFPTFTIILSNFPLLPTEEEGIFCVTNFFSNGREFCEEVYPFSLKKSLHSLIPILVPTNHLNQRIGRFSSGGAPKFGDWQIQSRQRA